MVSNEGRNNIIVLGVLIGFSLLITSFILTFVGNMERATDEVSTEVQAGVVNVTIASSTQSAILVNLSNIIDQQLQLQQEQRETTQDNIEKILGSLGNQTDYFVDSINELNNDSQESREQQTKAFIDTLTLSQNLTKISQNLTEERLAAEKNQSEKLDTLIQTFNLTLIPQVSSSPSSANNNNNNNS